MRLYLGIWIFIKKHFKIVNKSYMMENYLKTRTNYGKVKYFSILGRILNKFENVNLFSKRQYFWKKWNFIETLNNNLKSEQFFHMCTIFETVNNLGKDALFWIWWAFFKFLNKIWKTRNISVLLNIFETPNKLWKKQIFSPNKRRIITGPKKSRFRWPHLRADITLY